MLCSPIAWNQESCYFFGGGKAYAPCICNHVFSEGIGSGISCFSQKSQANKYHSWRCQFRPAWDIGLLSFQMLLPFFPCTRTLFSHISLYPFQDLGKTSRKVPKSFLILWNGSEFRTKLFLHLFSFKFFKKKKKNNLFFFFSPLFFCRCSYKKAGFWNPERQVLSPVLYVSGLTALELPCLLRSEIHPYKNPVSENSWCSKERPGQGIPTSTTNCFFFLLYNLTYRRVFFIILWIYSKGQQKWILQVDFTRHISNDFTFLSCRAGEWPYTCDLVMTLWLHPTQACQSFSLPVRQEQWDSPSSFWRLTQKKCHQWKSLRQRTFTDKHKPVVLLVMSALHSTD